MKLPRNKLETLRNAKYSYFWRYTSDTDETMNFETETENQGITYTRSRLRLRLGICLIRDRDWDWDSQIFEKSRIFRDFYLIGCLKKGLQTWPRCLHEIETETGTLGCPYTRPRLRLRLRKSLTRDWDRDWDSHFSRESRRDENLVCVWIVKAFKTCE